MNRKSNLREPNYNADSVYGYPVINYQLDVTEQQWNLLRTWETIQTASEKVFFSCPCYFIEAPNAGLPSENLICLVK